MKKLAFVASVASALVCTVALVATPADAAKKRAAKKPAAQSQQMAAGPGGYAAGPGGYAAGPGYNAGPPHAPGGPVKSGNMCWVAKDPWANTGQGYWKSCPKK